MFEGFLRYLGTAWPLVRKTRKPGSKKGFRNKLRNPKHCKMEFGTFAPRKPFAYTRRK